MRTQACSYTFFCFVLEYGIEEAGIITRSKTRTLKNSILITVYRLPYSTYYIRPESEFTQSNNYITEFYRTESEFTISRSYQQQQRTTIVPISRRRFPSKHSVSNLLANYQHCQSRGMNDYGLKFVEASKRDSLETV